MSNKIDLDKYYTPLDKAKYCIDKVYEIIRSLTEKEKAAIRTHKEINVSLRLMTRGK
jgi:hypothetical protein